MMMMMKMKALILNHRINHFQLLVESHKPKLSNKKFLNSMNHKPKPNLANFLKTRMRTKIIEKCFLSIIRTHKNLI